MTANERLEMMAADYERRAAQIRGEAAAMCLHCMPRNRIEAAQRTARKHEKEARELRATIQRNTEARAVDAAFRQ
jgi:hypothetical protein